MTSGTKFRVETEEEEKEEGAVQVSRWLAPQRVFTRISGTPLELCDYMFPDEKAEVCNYVPP